MEHLLEYAWSLLARTHRYQWGGDDPIQGFDCSGFVMELMFAAGEIPYGTPKLTAQGLYEFFEHRGGHNVWGPGSLAFYGMDATHIGHIGFCLDNYSILEAAGGNSQTTNDEVAIKQNAFLKMRPIKYRQDFLCLVKPKYVKIGMMP